MEANSFSYFQNWGIPVLRIIDVDTPADEIEGDLVPSTESQRGSRRELLIQYNIPFDRRIEILDLLEIPFRVGDLLPCVVGEQLVAADLADFYF